jgi:hypothetical protein
MNALSGPAAAGIDDRPLALDRRGWLRLIGGMMFASGAIVLLARKSQDWGDWAEFAALAIPAAVLLALAFAERMPVDRPGWQGAFLVFGTLLLFGALLQLVVALEGQPQGLNLAWTSAVAGAVAVASSFMLRVPFQMLLGALFGAVAWLALWDKILSTFTGEKIRWLLIVLAVIYLIAALMLLRQRRSQASDLITAAGILAVVAAALSFAVAASGFAGQAGDSLPGGVPKPGQGWNIFLLVVSLVLIGYGSRGRTRGPAYVGALGLAGFIGLTGSDLVNRLEGEGGGVVGWPLVLLIGGGLILALGFLVRPDQLGGGGAGPAGPGGPGLQAPVQPGAPGYGQPPTQAGYPQQPTQAGYPQQSPPPPPADPGATRAHQQPPAGPPPQS